MTVYEADWICPATSPPIRNGAIAVEKGRLVSVGLADSIPGAERVRFPGAALIPGFVNAHAHLELTILRGYLENLPFVEWIRRLVHVKYQKLTRADLKASAQLGAIEMLRAGVTAVGEVMDVGTGWEAMKEFGLQGIAYQEVFGPADSAAEEAMKGLRSRIEGARRDESQTSRIGVSPHAPYSVSKTLYLAARDYARSEALRLTAHIAESREESLFVRDGGGPFAANHKQREIEVTPRRCSPVAYLDSLGLLGPDMLLVHAAEADEDDFNRLLSSGTSVVHCPKSNAKLGNSTANVTAMQDAGVTVALGTDSVASNNCIDMFEEMRAAIFHQRIRAGRIDALTASDAFRMATIEGARCLGMESNFGSLETGKQADFAIIDLSGPATQPVYDPVETMVYSASRGDVKKVFIGGREVSLDASAILKRVSEIRFE